MMPRLAEGWVLGHIGSRFSQVDTHQCHISSHVRRRRRRRCQMTGTSWLSLLLLLSDSASLERTRSFPMTQDGRGVVSWTQTCFHFIHLFILMSFYTPNSRHGVQLSHWPCRDIFFYLSFLFVKCFYLHKAEQLQRRLSDSETNRVTYIRIQQPFSFSMGQNHFCSIAGGEKAATLIHRL